MLNPRWKKVLGDLISSPTRTLLVVLSIFIGVFAVGLITSSQAIIEREMNKAYLESNPAHATLSMSDDDSFNDDLLQAIRNMHEVGEAEGRRNYSMQVEVGYNDWRGITFVGIDDFDDIRIDKFNPVSGAWPPGDKEFLIERSGLSELNAEVGDRIEVERSDGKKRVIQIAGVVYAPNRPPAQFGGLTGFVDFETMEWLSGERDFNELLILSAENGDSQEHNEFVANLVYDKVQKSGRDPSFPRVPNPGEHPLDTFIGGMVMIMGAMGVLSVFLSGFLVTNTISALLAQQVKQIGILKSIGARSSQIIFMYMVLVACFGLIALALAYPTVVLATRGFTGLIAQQFNFDLSDFSVPLSILFIQVFISVAVPLLAAIYPVLAGTSVTIREALSSEGGPGGYGTGIIDRVIQRISGLPRPVLLSLRNTFRRKGRVALTLVTLTLGGSIFIAIFSVRDSLVLTLDDLLDSLFNFDVEVQLERDYRDSYIISEALSIPGVVEAEAWRQAGVRRLFPDDTEGESIVMWAVPPDSKMVRPTLISGRWLLPDDQNAIVLSNGVFQDDDDIALGDEIVLIVGGRETTWTVVGEVATIGAARWAYVGYDVYGRVARDVGAAGSLQIMTERHDREFQEAVATAIETHFGSLGINVSDTEVMANIRQRNETFFNVIVVGLLVMSSLIAVVGGLGLAGTMSLNVLERTREIGVMRAIGASDMTVLQVVMIEGLVLGALSWLLGASISFPISRLLSDQVGIQLFSFPLSFSFSIEGAVIWLIISLVLASVASFLPAWRASRVTVRDVLAYE